VVTVAVDGRTFSVKAKGERAKINEGLASALAGTADLTTLDARLVQPYYARILAEASALKLTMQMDGEDTVEVKALPLEAQAAA
jgi:histidine phosphotransferase ChpT